MKRRFELIVFDWDGTLIDSEANIVCCMENALADTGLPVLPKQDIRKIIGLGLDESVSTLLPESDHAVCSAVVERFRVHFLSSSPSSPFRGVESVLQQLHTAQYTLAIATGKSRRGLEHALVGTQFGQYFTTSRCADETRSKPHPDMLLEILDELGVAADSTLMVGDTEFDLHMANNANVASLAVTYGVHERDDLLKCGPLACLECIEDLLVYLDDNQITQG